MSTHVPSPKMGAASSLQSLAHATTSAGVAGGSAAKAAALPQTVLYEQLAHKYAYQQSISPEDQKWLADQGYVAGEPYAGDSGFALIAFTPLPAMRGKLSPVLAFRGTDKIAGADGADDFNPAGVGLHQFCANEGAVAEHLQLAATLGRVEAVGHSLGGALAQLAAVAYPSFVGHVTTFQSPGIGKVNAQTLKDYNKKSDRPIGSDHHRVKNDVVSQAGEAFTAGTVTDYTVDVGDEGPIDDRLARHNFFPATQAYLREHPSPGAGLDAGGAGKLVSRTSDCKEKGAGSLEPARKAVGGISQALQTLAPLEDSQAYDRLWLTYRNGLVSGMPLETILPWIESAPVLNKQQKARMQENLKKVAGVRYRNQQPAADLMKKKVNSMTAPKSLTVIK